MARPRWILTALTATVTIAWVAWAAPVIGDRNFLSNPVRSLAKINKIRVIVNPLFGTGGQKIRIPAVRFLPKEIADSSAKRLERADYKIANEAGLPRLVFNSVCVPHKDVFDVYSYAIYMTLEQSVHIPRLDQTLLVPTYVNVRVGVENVVNLNARITQGFRDMLKDFIREGESATHAAPE